MYKNELVATFAEISQNTLVKAKKSFSYYYEIITQRLIKTQIILQDKQATGIETKQPLKTPSENVVKLKISKTLGDALN